MRWNSSDEYEGDKFKKIEYTKGSIDRRVTETRNVLILGKTQ
jgi:hypothetical protein